MASNKLNFWNIYSSYALYYFGKVNLSLIMPLLLATQGFSKYNVGLVASGFFVTYAIGQFIHGHISEKFNPYIYIALGLIGSSIMNAFLGFFGMFFWLLFLGEAFDGFFQSMGWSSCVRAVSETSKNPQRTSCILGTSYQIGNSVAWLIASAVIGWWGWQWGFWIAAIIMFAKALILLKYMPKNYQIKPKPIIKQVKRTLNFPIVVSGMSLCLLNMVRYGIITWMPTFLYEVEKLSIGKVGLKIFLIPVFGVIGTLYYNKSKMNRDILTIIYMAGLALLFVIFPYVSPLWTTVLLLLSGALIYGPHVFLVSTMPSRFVDKEIVASSTGFIDGMGYIGTSLIGILVPFILSIWDWHYVFWFWSIIAFVIIIFVLIVYLKKGQNEIKPDKTAE